MEVQVESGSSNIVPLTDASREQKTTEEKLKDVLADLEKRRVNDDMMFARLREELDFSANTKKEDRDGNRNDDPGS